MPDRNSAARELREALRDRDLGIRPLDRRLRTGAFLEEWLEFHVKPKVRRSTYESYGAIVHRYLIPELGRIPLAQLGPEHVQKMLRGVPERGERGTLSPTTVRYVYKVLRIALGRALKLGRVHRNICTLIDPPRAPRRERQPMSADEARVFLASVKGDRLEALYRLAIATGLRQGELLALRWEDVDLDAGILVVRHTLQRRTLELVEPKTANARRYAALDETTVALLRAHKASQRVVRLADGLVFTTATGGPLDPRNVLRSFYGALAKAKLERQPFHQLRHACATMLLESGEELANVSKLLGHADLGTTADLYGHLTPTIARRASERMGAILAG
jgi:integrase